MSKSAVERQAEFRKKNKGKFKRLDTLISIKAFNLLNTNANVQGLTKSAYIEELLYSKDNQPKNGFNRNYDGNSKDFWLILSRILSKDRSRISNELKRACNALTITRKKNGQFYSDSDRLKVCQWLKDNHT